MNGCPLRVVAVMAIATMIVPSEGSRAAEDGGVRSVFAQGAGGRALAMGSAFVAVADDATAIMWNPAGLARVSRLEIEAGQTQYFGLDVGETYAAAVLPNWRWGAAAATVRHFGVGGIERRDDRNLLLGDDLTDSQTELAFGYGRVLREIWSVGAVVKYRRQSLAGFSANGFGIDVGLVTQPALAMGLRDPWAHDLTWGLALSNLVQPSLRLDRESVSDPTSVRTGLAYVLPLSGTRALVPALDFEKAGKSGTRLHAGVEARLHPLLAVRAGIAHGRLTAGSGMRWRDVRFDYVFEDNPVDGVHRVSLSYGFGPTVAESRTAALRAEEEATQARMAEAFQLRQAEQIASLLLRAEELHEAGQNDPALDLVSTIQTLEPNHPRARALEVDCLRGKAADLERAGEFADAAIAFGRVLTLAPEDPEASAGHRRCQAESDQRAARSAELRRQFAAAIDAFGADRLLEARAAFQEILTTEPSDEDAAVMLRRTEQSIARRVESLLKQARRYVGANLLDEAAALVDEAAKLDVRAQGLSETRAALARARQRAAEGSRAASQAARDSAQGLAAPAERIAVALSPQKRREIEQLYRRGLEAMEERRSDEALRYWELVWSADPGFQQVAEYLKREYLTRGMESFAAGRLDEAAGFWERALKVDPADERARGYLDRAQKQLVRTREILGSKE